MDLVTILQAAQSADNVIRKQAETALQNLEESNFAVYVTSLSAELRNDARPENIRQLCGLMLKNAFDSENEHIAFNKQNRWREQPPAVKAQVKSDLILSLAAAVPNARQAAAQAVAKVGKIEVPNKQWPELVDGLVHAALGEVPLGTKAASITALGFLCEEIEDPSVLPQADRDKILSAIVTNMADTAALEVKKAAVTGMNHALDFADENFKDEKAAERDAIMSAIMACTADSSGSMQVRIPAFDCLLRVAELYYSSLRPYIERLATITSTAALGAEEDIAVRAVEFWNSIAEEEKTMSLEDPSNCRYITAYATPLTSMLTSLMTKVEEEHDDESYTIAQAASNCLASCSIAAENSIVDPVMAFIGASFASPQWQLRDAATVAFGCIQQGPDSDKLKPLIAASLGTLISRLAGPAKDPNVVVRDSTAWTLCKIMENNFDAVDHATHYQPLLKAIFEALNDEARVAANAAYTVHNLAPHMPAYELKDGTTPLSPYFTVLVQSLIARADKDDWNEHKLRAVCYEAVTMMVSEAATEHEHPFLLMLLNEVGARLTRTVNTTPMTTDDKHNVESMLTVLTALTQELVSELDEKVKPVAAGLVELLLRAMDAQHAAAAEQAFYAIGSISDAIADDFIPLLPAVLPKVILGIQNASHGKICEAAIWASGEITRNVGAAVTPYSDAVVSALLDILRRVETTRDSKTSALAVFGDVASAMGPEVGKYVRGMMLMLDKAAGTKPESDEPEDVDYVVSLRKSVGEAWQGLFQAFVPGDGADEATKKKMQQESAILHPYVKAVVDYSKEWLADALKRGIDTATGLENDDELDLELFKVLLGLLGDISGLFGKQNVATMLKKDEPVIRKALEVEDRLERSQWMSQHDEDGARKMTVAQFCKKVMP